MSATFTVGFLRAALVVATAAALAGCIKIESRDEKSAAADAAGATAPPAPSTDDGWTKHIEFHGAGLSYDGDTVVISQDGAKARIAANGDLAVDGRPVTVDAAQRQALTEYHAAALQLRENAKGLAGEGVDLGKAVVAEVLHGIAKGDVSQVEKTAETKADALRRSAGRLCTDLATMRGVQERLTATLAEFRPFATIDQKDLDDCTKDTGPEGGSVVAASTPGG
jgi:hypothetical protein